MKLWLSGYGKAPMPTIRQWDTEANAVTASIPEQEPTWLIPDGRRLLAVQETDRVGAVVSYAEGPDGWQVVDVFPVRGGALCHIALNEDKSLLAGTCYGNGDVVVVRVNPDGRFGETLLLETQAEAGRTESRAHYAQFFGDALYTVNLGLDRIIRYRVEGAALREDARLSLPNGSGPRHLCLSTRRNRLYCISEYSNQLFVVEHQGSVMKLLSAHNARRDSNDIVSYGSGICLSPDERFVYAAIRGEDSIACFSLDETGGVTGAAHSDCHGHWPRHIILLDDGRFLGIANEHSGEAVLLPRDETTGVLGQPALRFSHARVSFIGV